MTYPTLFSPAVIGTLRLPNRIIMGSMHIAQEGRPESVERMCEFYAARARGGAGLIITGGCAVNAEAAGGPHFSSVFRPEDQDGLRRVADRVHREGGRIGLQLFHAGRYARPEWLSDVRPVAPSPIRPTLHATTPREMTEEDILRTIVDFAQGAAHARNTGYDCVELMGSEGYLINEFLSPLTNRREDLWGGPIENRIRFGQEVMLAVRRKVGRDYPVVFRASGIDLMPGSNGWEETIRFMQAVEEAGADAINIGIGWHESRIPTISMLVPPAYYGFVGARLKPHLRLPCIASNRINDPQVAEDLLASGSADFVSMARPLLADPEFSRKAASGRSDLINTCIACNQACLDNVFRDLPAACILNPEAGREKEMRILPAECGKRVAVVGAGPAGLEAARVLAARGHQVTLFEKSAEIGGQLLFAVKVPGKQEFLNTIRYYRNWLRELKVQVETGCAPEITDLATYDAVVVATGARPATADVPMADDGVKCIDYEGFFAGPSPDGDVLVLGAGGIGCDIAHMLVAEGLELYPAPDFFDDPNRVRDYEERLRSLPRTRRVTITRRGKRIGEKLGLTTRWALLQILENRGVQMVTQVEYLGITREGLLVRGRNGAERLLPADVVILAAGQIPNDTLFHDLAGTVENCRRIGGARSASETNAQTAIMEASELARTI